MLPPAARRIGRRARRQPIPSTLAPWGAKLASPQPGEVPQAGLAAPGGRFAQQPGRRKGSRQATMPELSP
jgi:hypothetical protein